MAFFTGNQLQKSDKLAPHSPADSLTAVSCTDRATVLVIIYRTIYFVLKHSHIALWLPCFIFLVDQMEFNHHGFRSG